MDALAAVTICAALLALMATLLTFAAASVVTLEQIRSAIFRCPIVPRPRGPGSDSVAGTQATTIESQLCIGLLVDHDQVAPFLRFVFYQLPLLRWRMHVAALLILVPSLLVGTFLGLHIQEQGWKTASTMVSVALLLMVASVFLAFVVSFLVFLFGERAKNLYSQLEKLKEGDMDVDIYLSPRH